MKNIVVLLIIIVACSCTKPQSVPAPTNTFYGTYNGTDSIQTFSNGSLVNTTLYNKSITVVSSNVAGRNAIILGYISDSLAANFANNTIAFFPNNQPIANLTGSYTTTTLKAYYETGGGNGMQKIFSTYTKQ